MEVGDVVKVQKDQFFPADLIALETSNVKGKIFVETKNLDGETNLKKKGINDKLKDFKKRTRAGDETPESSLGKFLNDLRDQNLAFSYEAPTDLLYEFKGNLTIRNKETDGMDTFSKQTFGVNDANTEEAKTEREVKIRPASNSQRSPLQEKNLLLRGSILRNTEWIVGIVVYTGHDTKIMMNSVKAKPKRSKLEEQLNKYILIIFFFLIFFCMLGSFMNVLWLIQWEEHSEYMFLSKSHKVVILFKRFGNWILIFGNLVPISLMVSLETVKFIQAILIHMDRELVSFKEEEIPCEVQSSNLNEELGQIEYIFSDKTGTLTCNEMVFRKLIIGDQPFGLYFDEDLNAEIKKQDSEKSSDDLMGKGKKILTLTKIFQEWYF